MTETRQYIGYASWVLCSAWAVALVLAVVLPELERKIFGSLSIAVAVSVLLCWYLNRVIRFLCAATLGVALYLSLIKLRSE